MNQNADKNLRQLVLERYYAQVAQGVQRFTHPTSVRDPHSDSRVENAYTAPARPELVRRLKLLTEHFEATFLVRVAVAQEQLQKPFFVLADFPEAADETQPELFSADGAASVLLTRLFSRLGMDGHVHRSFALKALPRRGFTAPLVALCQEMLECELLLCAPAFVICFGARAASMLEAIAHVKLEPVGPSAVFEWRGLSVRPFVFPSPRELATFPEWRAGVWEELQALGPTR